MLLEFADWWIAQMRSMLPPGLMREAAQPDARIIAIAQLADRPGGKPAGSILLRRAGLETLIASLDLSKKAQRPLAQPSLATGLRLPRDQILSRQVMLPLAAARNLETVIGFEMDRLTPFTADELFWSIGGVRQDRLQGRIKVDLFIVLRAQVENLLQTLHGAGLAPSFIEAGAGRIDLASDHRPAQWRKAWLAAVCAVLALACLLTPVLRQQMALTSAANDVAALSPAAATAQRLRERLDTATSGQTAIDDATRTGDALQVLAALTAALPDGTWLDDLTLKSGDLTFDGRSADAAALIGLLSSVPSLKNPSFTAPVTRTADGGADQFSIHTTVQE